MPGSDIEIKKLVGKVNYASSMQSHKQGATKLFHDGYIQPESGLNTSWMNGGRKAVLEDEFLYFFVNVPKEDLNSITWDYFREIDADGNKTGNYNFENCYFLGFQTWGSAKGDEPTSGYDDSVPYYLMLEGADNDNSAANFKTPWASMQIWGNYKGGTEWVSANSTFIETPSNTPTVDKNYYHQFAGGTKNPSTGLWTPEYINGLLIKDETIVFDPGTESGSSSDKKADAWDVDFGCTEGVGYTEKGKWYLDGEDVDKGTPGAVQAQKDNLFWVFEDKAKESLKRFAQFYNLVYTFDFSSLYYIGDDVEIDGNSMEIDGTPIYHRKLIFGDNCTINYDGTKVNPLPGDIYRWEKAWPNTVMTNSVAKWVPAGLYHNGKDWESLNIATICNWYNHAAMGHGTYPAEYAFFAKEEYKSLKTIGDNGKYKYIFDDPNVLYSFNGYDDSLGSQLKTLQACMAEAFKIIMYEFTDVEDVSYHQAFIKLVAGTDNRAKNTYFQIVGPIYTNKYASPINGEVEIVKTTIKDEEGSTKDLLGYVKDGQLYEVTIDGESITETGEIFDVGEAKTKSVYYKNTGNGDFKIRLYQDDLDTIFKTDNNGQQVKPYYLLEPPYNRNLESLWGDLHSGMFYNYDLIFTDKIKDHLSRLLRFATGGEWPDNPSTKFNEYFFTVQKNLPSIAYNHMSEIYYESVQTLWQDGKGTTLYDTFSANGGDSWKDFTNNKVYDPVSLSHGSCLEAEIEYLRDRVLLLSTYTNSAKNQTDTNILLNGGSATTQGREVTISTSYTSFIQYIYPIINNQISYKTSTSLDYDPLLDYMSWNTEQGRYNQIDLAYNIALPNESLDVSVKFQLSPLTTNSYWTSTDLYRTLHIKQGADTFSSLFTFPNASTVISQDPKYVITPSEGSEINVVDHLESVEHLVLQNATITSSGLDFTGCNRLKTLVLGKTENNQTDSPEDTAPNDINWYAVEFEDVLDSEKTIQLQAADASLGFEQLILPKSNSVEQLILPNCIKTVHINHYPKLRRLEFNAGTELINLTVDGRNSLSTIEYIITNFTGQYTTTLEITNIPSNFWLSETVCRKITTIPNVKIEGTVNIGNGSQLASIDWSTKKMLVEKFGNIETGNVKFNYNKINFDGSDVIVSAAGTIENSGVAPISITISGNNIPIASDNKHLKIEYSITEYTTVTSTQVYFTDKYTPYLNIVEGSEGSIKVRTRIYYESSKYIDSTTNITIGFYEPKPGDFAYANGTFNSAFDPTLGLVGVVFYTWKYPGTDSDTYDVRVLGANFSSEDQPLAPASYALNKNWSSSNYHETYNELLLDLELNPSEYYSDVANRAVIASGQITYNSTSEGVSLHKVQLQDTKELEYQKTYITRANNFIKKIGKSITSVTSLEESGFEKPTIEGRSRFEQVLSDFAGIVKLEKVNGTTHDYEKKECGGSFLYGLYPAFLKALYYTPNVYLTEKGSEYFGIGNWYVPNSLEIERIIYYRINSAISKGANSEDYWNSTTHVGINVSGDELNKLNVFTRNAFENIKLLGNTSSLISSEENGEGEGEGLAYGYEYWSSRPSWINQCNDYYSTCGRDQKHVISPVCRVVLTKSKNS